MATRIDGYVLAEAQEELARWKAAVAALASSQSYTIDQRTLTRVNLDEARNMVGYFAGLVDRLQAGGTGGVTVRRIVPRDL